MVRRVVRARRRSLSLLHRTTASALRRLVVRGFLAPCAPAFAAAASREAFHVEHRFRASWLRRFCATTRSASGCEVEPLQRWVASPPLRVAVAARRFTT